MLSYLSRIKLKIAYYIPIKNKRKKLNTEFIFQVLKIIEHFRDYFFFQLMYMNLLYEEKRQSRMKLSLFDKSNLFATNYAIQYFGIKF